MEMEGEDIGREYEGFMCTERGGKRQKDIEKTFAYIQTNCKFH